VTSATFSASGFDMGITKPDHDFSEPNHEE